MRGADIWRGASSANSAPIIHCFTVIALRRSYQARTTVCCSFIGENGERNFERYFDSVIGRYVALSVDNRIGSTTLEALRAFVQWRGENGGAALLRGLNGSQAARYLNIAGNNKTQRKYLFGWVSHRVQGGSQGLYRLACIRLPG